MERTVVKYCIIDDVTSDVLALMVSYQNPKLSSEDSFCELTGIFAKSSAMVSVPNFWVISQRPRREASEDFHVYCDMVQRPLDRVSFDVRADGEPRSTLAKRRRRASGTYPCKPMPTMDPVTSQKSPKIPEKRNQACSMAPQDNARRYSKKMLQLPTSLATNGNRQVREAARR